MMFLSHHTHLLAKESLGWSRLDLLAEHQRASQEVKIAVNRLYSFSDGLVASSAEPHFGLNQGLRLCEVVGVVELLDE